MFQLKKDTSIEEVNALLNEKANGELKGILEVDSQFRVSSDFVSCPVSSIVAGDLTQVIAGNMVKIMAWYDNEWGGYSVRLVDMALHVSK